MVLDNTVTFNIGQCQSSPPKSKKRVEEKMYSNQRQRSQVHGQRGNGGEGNSKGEEECKVEERQRRGEEVTEERE